MHCPCGNATDPIWRVLGSFDGISSWTPLKPKHSNPNPHPLANQLWCIDFLIPPTPLIIPHRLPAFLESLMPLKNWCSIHVRCSKSSLKHSKRFCGIFPSLKQHFIAYRSSKGSDCIFEIHQLWQSDFSRVYSNSYCSCLFEPEIIKIGLSSYKMHSNNILTFQDSKTILNAWTKKSGNFWMPYVYIYIYIYIHIYICIIYLFIYILYIVQRILVLPLNTYVYIDVCLKSLSLWQFFLLGAILYRKRNFFCILFFFIFYLLFLWRHDNSFRDFI